MNRSLKAALAATLALIMALTAIPFSALPRFAAKAETEPEWTVPPRYNVDDYNKCVEFLEQTDEKENGLKNGEKLSSTYNPRNPETWGVGYHGRHFQWTEVNGDMRLWDVNISNYNLYGSLDLSECTKLQHLSCDENNLTELVVSGCTSVRSLYCSSNNLGALDVSDCTGLTYLYCSSNNLGALNVSNNKELFSLDCSNNKLEKLDVTKNTKLFELDCSSNNLTKLNVSDNTKLDRLDCSSNKLTELTVGNNIWLSDIDCSDNKLTALTELEASDDTKPYYLNCSNNLITTLDVSNNSYLLYMYCSGNNLNELSINAELRSLDCSNNNLTELDLSSNTELSELYCSGNNLAKLDLSSNTELEWLYCCDNNLTELVLSNNPRWSYEHILAEGNGHIGYSMHHGDDSDDPMFSVIRNRIYACPMSGASFEGFYDESGALISEGEWSDEHEAYFYEYKYFYIEERQTTGGTIIARFSDDEAIPGDVDGDGTISVLDALITLRIAMQINDGSGMNNGSGDMDGTGDISVVDALMIMRVALGIS